LIIALFVLSHVVKGFAFDDYVLHYNYNNNNNNNYTKNNQHNNGNNYLCATTITITINIFSLEKIYKKNKSIDIGRTETILYNVHAFM